MIRTKVRRTPLLGNRVHSYSVRSNRTQFGGDCLHTEALNKNVRYDPTGSSRRNHTEWIPCSLPKLEGSSGTMPRECEFNVWMRNGRPIPAIDVEQYSITAYISESELLADFLGIFMTLERSVFRENRDYSSPLQIRSLSCRDYPFGKRVRQFHSRLPRNFEHADIFATFYLSDKPRR